MGWIGPYGYGAGLPLTQIIQFIAEIKVTCTMHIEMSFIFEIRSLFDRNRFSISQLNTIRTIAIFPMPISNANFQCVQTSFHPAQLFLGDDVTANFEIVFFHCADSKFHVFVTINTLYCILQHSWIALSMFLRKPSQRASGSCNL